MNPDRFQYIKLIQQKICRVTPFLKMKEIIILSCMSCTCVQFCQAFDMVLGINSYHVSTSQFCQQFCTTQFCCKRPYFKINFKRGSLVKTNGTSRIITENTHILCLYFWWCSDEVLLVLTGLGLCDYSVFLLLAL